MNRISPGSFVFVCVCVRSGGVFLKIFLHGFGGFDLRRIYERNEMTLVLHLSGLNLVSGQKIEKVTPNFSVFIYAQRRSSSSARLWTVAHFPSLLENTDGPRKVAQAASLISCSKWDAAGRGRDWKEPWEWGKHETQGLRVTWGTLHWFICCCFKKKKKCQHVSFAVFCARNPEQSYTELGLSQSDLCRINYPFVYRIEWTRNFWVNDFASIYFYGWRF